LVRRVTGSIRRWSIGFNNNKYILNLTGDFHAWQRQFDRSKPHVNIGTIGTYDQWGNPLTAAITTSIGCKGSVEFKRFLFYRQRARRKEEEFTIILSRRYSTEEDTTQRSCLAWIVKHGNWCAK